MKDYGNISSSGNNSVDDLIDDLYNFQYELKINLPLDIIDDSKNNKKNKHKNVSKDNSEEIDLSVLTRVLIPQNVLKNQENNKVWTFDSILHDLQSTFNKN